VTLVGKAKNYNWNKLIWILCTTAAMLSGRLWEWHVDEYGVRFDTVNRLSPAHMRQGRRIFPRA
jgi:hypothetical protein